MRTLSQFCSVTVFLLLCTGCTENQADGSRSINRPDTSIASTQAMEDLLWGVRAGDIERVRSALADGADVNTDVDGGGPLLHEAVEEGHTEVVKLLIAHGAALTAQPEWWHDATALHLAAELGHREIAELLIAHGAPLDARDADGMTPLHKAAWEGHKEIVELLVAQGADVRARDLGQRTPLHEVAAGDYARVVRAFFRSRYGKVDHNDDGAYAARDKAEHEFITNVKLDLVNLLVAKGADVNAEDYVGGTPLSDAASSNELPLVELLLAKGARPDRRNKFDGRTVLHTFIWYGGTDVLPTLLKHGADVNVRDGNGQTLLHEAIWADSRELVELLVARGAAMNLKDKNGDTPAHVAAMTASEDLLVILASNGADLKVRNKEGLKPADYLRAEPPKEMIRLSPEASLPYSVIITDVRNIRNILQANMIAFDRIWTPAQADIRATEAILRKGLTGAEAIGTTTWFSREDVLGNFDVYSREYAGFTKGRRKHVFINMRRHGDRNAAPQENRFSPRPYDGGCSTVRVVIDLTRRRVIRIDCNEC